MRKFSAACSSSVLAAAELVVLVVVASLAPLASTRLQGLQGELQVARAILRGLHLAWC